MWLFNFFKNICCNNFSHYKINLRTPVAACSVCTELSRTYDYNGNGIIK